MATLTMTADEFASAVGAAAASLIPRPPSVFSDEEFMPSFGDGDGDLFFASGWGKYSAPPSPVHGDFFASMKVSMPAPVRPAAFRPATTVVSALDSAFNFALSVAPTSAPQLVFSGSDADDEGDLAGEDTSSYSEAASDEATTLPSAASDEAAEFDDSDGESSEDQLDAGAADDDGDADFAPAGRRSRKRRVDILSAASSSSQADAAESAASAKRRRKNARAVSGFSSSSSEGENRVTGFSKRGRAPKRPATPLPEVTAQTSAKLPRDALLDVSSADLDAFAIKLEKIRNLTADEKRELQRQRRLVKNRESAQLSRMRKKSMIDTLEEAIAKVLAQTTAVKAEIAAAKVEEQHLLAMLA